MNKARIKSIDRKYKPEEGKRSFVIVEPDGSRTIDGKKVSQEEASAYLQRSGETFEVVGVEHE